MDIPRNKVREMPRSERPPTAGDGAPSQGVAPSQGSEKRFDDAPAMDVPRGKKARTKKRVRKIVYAVVGVAALAAITVGLTKIKPAAPSVEAGTLYKGTVARGEMLRQVRGAGTLVPENVRIIAAAQQGLVERVLVQPGAEVSAGTVLVELSNPELQQSSVDTEYQLRAAEAEYNNIKAKLESDRLSQQAVTANVHAEYEQAKLQADTDAQLAKEGLVPALNLKLSKSRADELANRYAIEQKRLEGTKNTAQAQLASQTARISQLKALLDLKHQQLGTLKVVAGTNGVVRDTEVKEGQQVTPGTELAHVVEPE
ncbi:MAG: efflux RND transporter periplasmic adaptor subunit, partial [Acidobacteria bacterium]|nr:efflux RND transporter periplasmic adaptor subunit [Acidobacteriota bacterium]